MGRIAKGVMCSCKGCDIQAVRSVNTAKAKNAGLDVEGNRAYLCKEHYKAYKKGNRESDRIERWRHGIP